MYDISIKKNEKNYIYIYIYIYISVIVNMVRSGIGIPSLSSEWGCLCFNKG